MYYVRTSEQNFAVFIACLLMYFTNILSIPSFASGQNLALGDIRDIITDANFGVDRLRGFSVARGQILGFSIGFCRRPYNTLALPCECVM